MALSVFPTRLKDATCDYMATYLGADNNVLVTLISTIGSIIALYFKRNHASNRALLRMVKKHALQIEELYEWKEKCQSSSHYF